MAEEHEPDPERDSWIKRHSLGIVVVGAFLAFTTAALGFGWVEYTDEQAAHGAPATAGGFWLWFGFEYSMSLVADVFGIVLLVFLTKRLYELGSAESK